MGGCVIVNGSVFYGIGQAGELGHMKIAVPAGYENRFSADPNPPCGCGGQKCVETRASLTGLIRRVTWALSDAGVELIKAELEAEGREFNPGTVAKLRELYEVAPKRAAYEVRTFADAHQDAFCRWLLEDWAIMIGALFASLAPALHPDLLIIGGGMTEISGDAQAWFLNVVKNSYAQTNAQRSFESKPGNCEIVWSVSTDQGWRGAILMGIRAE